MPVSVGEQRTVAHKGSARVLFAQLATTASNLSEETRGHELDKTETLEIDQIAENLITPTLSTDCRDL